jgi:N-acyl-phosphatidylethanolamine-hydrolysing phospholipase D
MKNLYFSVMKQKRYTNSLPVNTRRTLWDLLLWKTGRLEKLEESRKAPPDFVYPTNLRPFDRDLPSALWIGHSSFLIEVGGLAILTDPVWDTYCSPVPFQGLRRRHEPPLSLSDLPPIDYVLLSHNHYDHLDRGTVQHLKAFHPQIQWIVPKGLSRWFKRRGIETAIELGWWESLPIPGGSVTATPAQHFSGRTFWDQNKTHWNGYVLEKDKKRLYFTGDTGYNEVDFKAIGNRWASMDLSLIPIGTYVPKTFMQPVHCSPPEAVEIHQDVHSLFSIGMHWKTFCLSDEPLDLPPYDLYLSMLAKKLKAETFIPIDPGVYVNW